MTDAEEFAAQVAHLRAEFQACSAAGLFAGREEWAAQMDDALEGLEVGPIDIDARMPAVKPPKSSDPESGWGDLFAEIAEQASRNGMDVRDARVAWLMGFGALETARGYGRFWTHSNASQAPGYSPDRLSLAQEIADTLKKRGRWVPKEWAGPDLITAVGRALDLRDAEACCSTCGRSRGFGTCPQCRGEEMPDE
jgi:hypothetical protein